MPTVEHKEVTSFGYQHVQVDLDDRFTAMLYFEPDAELPTEEEMVTMAEQRRVLRGNFSKSENVKRGYYPADQADTNEA